jgi:hypothetical protein
VATWSANAGRKSSPACFPRADRIVNNANPTKHAVGRSASTTIKPQVRLPIEELFDRPIAFHRIFAEVTGSVNAGLLLSQFVYWSKRTSKGDGWFWKTQEELKEETAMTRRQQETARKILCRAGLTHEKRKGVPPKTWFKVDLDCLEKLLVQYGGNRHSGLAQTYKPETREAPDRDGRNRQPGEAETARHLLLSETTSETTHRGSSRDTSVSGGGGHPPNTDATAAFRAFGFDDRMATKRFQRIVVQRSGDLRNGNIVAVMEKIILDCQDCHEGVPPAWYELKHAYERADRQAAAQTDRRPRSNGPDTSFSREALQKYIADNATLIKQVAANLVEPNRKRRLLQIAKCLDGIELPAAPDTEFLESQLTAYGEKLHGVLADLAGPELMKRLRREIDAELSRSRRGRPNMSEEQLTNVGKQSLQTRLLAEFKLPRLSLLYMQDSKGKAANQKIRKRRYANAVESGYLFGEQQ